MIKNIKLLAALALALNISYLPNSFAVTDQKSDKESDKNLHMVIGVKTNESANKNNLQANQSIQSTAASPVQSVVKQIHIACPKSLQPSIFNLLDKNGSAAIPVMVRNQIQDIKFLRTPNDRFWNIDAGDYKMYMKEPGNFDAYKLYEEKPAAYPNAFKGLIFEKADIDVHFHPEKIKCIYKYTLPVKDAKGAKGAKNITVDRTRRIDITYLNPQ